MKILTFFKKWGMVIIGSVMITLVTLFSINTILYTPFHVEHLEYVDVDFEWVDDFDNYEIAIEHKGKTHYLTIKTKNVKFIYANENFLDFVVVDHAQRLVDKKDSYYIKSFYINLNYKEEIDDD